MAIVYYPIPVQPMYPAFLYNPYSQQPRIYLCPYCSSVLFWIPRRNWYCPIHGHISSWRYRFL
ncbi:MAG: hypothetical protein QW390_01335 [Candidatus Bathyarchaeia archaeon]